MKIKRRRKKTISGGGIGQDVTRGKTAKAHYRKVEIGDKSTSNLADTGRGFFDVASDIIGKTDFGIKKFLVFYFDDEGDYELCLKHFIDKKKKLKAGSKNPPFLDTKLLVKFIKTHYGS